MYVGIDASTSIVAWTFMHFNGTFHSFHYVDLRKEKDLYIKLDMFMSKFQETLKENAAKEIIKVGIESPLLMVWRRSTAHVIGLLQRWNGMVCSAIYRNLGIKCFQISAINARTLMKIKFPKKRTSKVTKEIVVEHIKRTKHIPDSCWSYNKNGKMQVYCFDQADSYVIARACYLMKQ